MTRELFEQRIQNKFLGRKIVNVRYLTSEEAEKIGIDRDVKPIVIFLDDGTQFCPVSHDWTKGQTLLTNIKNLDMIPPM